MATKTPRNTETPPGIIIFGILQIIISVITIFSKGLGVIGFIFLLFFSASVYEGGIQEILGQSTPENMIPLVIAYTIGFAAIYLALAVLGIIASIGVLMTKEWARKTLIGIAIAILSLNVIAIGAGFFVNQTGSILFLIPSIIWLIIKAGYYGFLITYFNKANVKSVFT